MRVAVVIVTKNDPRLDACLASVAAQDFPEPFPIVVVHNGSDATHVSRARARWAQDPRVEMKEIPGVFSAAWNQGAFALDVDVVARLDSDTIARPDWLRRLVDPLRTRPDLAWTAGAVVGPTPLRSLTQRYFHHRTRGYEARLQGDPLPTDAVPSWNVAYRLSALRSVGGYDPWQRSSIDWDLHKRLARAGHRGLFVPDAVLTHDHPARLRDFYRKEAWYRTGQYQMMLKYGPGAVASAWTLPATYVALAGVALLGTLDPRWGYLAYFGLLFLVFKQWLTAALEGDATWWARPLYRLVEATAALHGLLRGALRFGLHRRPIPGPA